MARPINKRLNEINKNMQGLSMKIIEYESSTEITVMFDDGYISKSRTYQEFINGKILNKNFRRSNFKDMLGEKQINKDGYLMEIIRYNGHSDVDIRFDDGTVLYNTNTKHFKDGNIKNPNHRGLYGVGYIGIGVKPYEDSLAYKSWSGMLERCYNTKFKEKRKTYYNCYCDKEWHNFQNFVQWFNSNIWNTEICKNLDKDILIKGNKYYSPNTCILVDDRLNSLFIKCDSARGKYPIGVSYHGRDGRYSAQCCFIDNNKRKTKWLGYYNKPKEAFNAYKQFKESYIKQVADEYKSKYPNFPQKLYDAMYSYEVEITD